MQTQIADRSVDGSQGGDDYVLIPLDRSGLTVTKAVKFSVAEWDKMQKFMEWLTITINPMTGQPFIARAEFSSLVQFSLNLSFRTMGQVAEEMAGAEARA